MPARPYSRLALAYDAVLGWPSFLRTRRTFERLQRVYGLRFRSAADIGCGTGLFARYLNRCWGARVYGVDRSPQMLAQAQRLACSPGVRWLRQDMRCLLLPEPVDLVTGNFDTVNHLLSTQDLRRAFGSVHANLNPGGHFLFDVVTFCRPLGGARAWARVLRACGRRVEQRIRWEPRARSITIKVLQHCSTRAAPAVEWHHERAFSPAEVGQALFDTGFVIRGIHDAATLQTAVTCPPRLVVLARRPRGN